MQPILNIVDFSTMFEMFGKVGCIVDVANLEDIKKTFTPLNVDISNLEKLRATLFADVRDKFLEKNGFNIMLAINIDTSVVRRVLKNHKLNKLFHIIVGNNDLLKALHHCTSIVNFKRVDNVRIFVKEDDVDRVKRFKEGKSKNITIISVNKYFVDEIN